VCVCILKYYLPTFPIIFHVVGVTASDHSKNGERKSAIEEDREQDQ
jgi:hypothetical protein